jgi:HYR domain
MNSSKRLAVALAAVVAIVYGCSGDSPTDPGPVHQRTLRAQAECGESVFLMALSTALPAWEDSIETWRGNTALLNTAPTFTGQSTTDYLVALVPVLGQWETAINTDLDSTIVDSVATFDPNTSPRQAYLTGLSSLLGSWKTDLEAYRGITFLPAPPVFVPDTIAPEIVCLADTTISSPDSLVVVNFEVTAVDDCDPAPVVTCTPPSGSSFPAGATLVTCTAVDSLGNQSSCTFTVNIGSASSAPEITCPDDITVTCAPESGVEVEFEVTAIDDNDPAPVVTSVPLSGSVFPVGETLVTSTAMDSDGNESTCTFTVTVEEAEPGEIASAKARPSVLWPPNHRWVDVRIDVDMDGGCVDGSDISWTVTRVTSNEAVNGNGDGNTSPDWIITDDGVRLRAERSGNGSGRIYTVFFEGDDGTEGSVRVRVPHNR